MKKAEHKGGDRFGFAVFFLFLGLSFFYGMNRIYGFTLLPDEFGYWSSAAQAVGYDWSDVVSRGSYYSFGYGLILAPILLLCHDAVTAYRVALGVNLVLLAVTFVLLQGMLKKLFPENEAAHPVWYAAIAVCYPTWLLYMNMTMTEVLLVFCFTLVCSLFLRYLDQPSAGRFAAVVVSAAYMYTVHMRTVPILMACIGCLLFSLVWKGTGKAGRIWRRRIFSVLLTAVILILAETLKQVVLSRVYGKADAAVLAVNDYAGQAGKLKSLFTWKGILEFLVSLAGKLYYLGFASFGLFFAGIRHIGRKGLDSREEIPRRIFYCFITLSVVGQILVCAVYTKGYGRVDGLFYGRYDEHILPVVMAIGCCALAAMKHPVRYAGLLLLGGLPAVAMLEWVIVSHQMTKINSGFFIAGFSYLLRFLSFEPENYFWKAYLVSAVLICALTALILIVRRKGTFAWMLAIWVGVEALLGISLNEDMVYRYAWMRYQDGRMVSQMEEIRKEPAAAGEDGARRRRIVCYGSPGSGVYAGIVQFQLREEKIYFFTPEETAALKQDDLVLVYGDGEDRTFLEERYSTRDAYGSFWLFYNE